MASCLIKNTLLAVFPSLSHFPTLLLMFSKATFQISHLSQICVLLEEYKLWWLTKRKLWFLKLQTNWSSQSLGLVQKATLKMCICNLKGNVEPWEKSPGASCFYICLCEWLKVVYNLSWATLVWEITKTFTYCNNTNFGIGSWKISRMVGPGQLWREQQLVSGPRSFN